jgi:hypothetical protein
MDKVLTVEGISSQAVLVVSNDRLPRGMALFERRFSESICPSCGKMPGGGRLRNWLQDLDGRMPWRRHRCGNPTDSYTAGPGFLGAVLSCPLCKSHSPDDYTVSGYGSQPPGGVEYFSVFRCLKHGVESADAPPAPRDRMGQESSLEFLYGDPNQRQPRYIEFMDQVEAVVGGYHTSKIIEGE